MKFSSSLCLEVSGKESNMMENKKKEAKLSEDELNDVSGGHAISRSIYDPRSGRSKEIKCKRCGRHFRVLIGSEATLCIGCRQQGRRN